MAVAARGLGQTRTERVVLHAGDDPFTLVSGERLAEVEVAFERYGEPRAGGANTVVVCHALTGDAHAAGHHGDVSRPGWWDSLIGPGRAVDTDRLHVVCMNLLGGCSGTTGPGSLDPDTGRRYGLRFPLPAVADQVALHRRLLAELGIERPLAAIGGSLGGMQALDWSLSHPGELGGAVIVCATDRLSAQAIALSTVAREAIVRDPQFHGGDYPSHGTTPADGLSVARMLGHITYLSAEGMEERFGRRRVGGAGEDAPLGLRGDFEVERYLQHQAERFLQRFDANSYLYLSRTMDGFDAFADRERLRAAGGSTTRHLVVSFDSDWRFPPAMSDRIATTLRAAGLAAEHRMIASPFGHDSFLLQPPGYREAVRGFLDGLLAARG